MNNELDIPYPLSEDMGYAARYGNTTPMNVIWCMMNNIELARKIRHETGVCYHNSHDLKELTPENRDEAIASVRRKSVPASLLIGQRLS